MHAHDGTESSQKPEIPLERKRLVLRELELILDSAPFRGSRRCQQFLRYSVEHTLANQSELLKERSIGVAVFGRAPSYDTGEDAIVRVSAKEVRNRLLQYYAGLGSEPAVRVELAPGSYSPEFQWSNRAVEENPPEVVEKARIPRWIFLAAAVVVAGVAGWLLLRPAQTSRDVRKRFWAPTLESSRPVLICVANPVVYRFEDQVNQRFGAAQGEAALKPLPLPPDAVIYGREVIPDPDEYVAVGDTLAATRLTALFARSGKNCQVRPSVDISFADLRSSPAVLIGAFTNEWTLELMKEWRFVFDLPGGWLIRDRANPTRTWEAPALRHVLRGRKVTEDHALISRVFERRSGQPVVEVAGLTHFGTGAAAEFLSEENLLAQALQDAPAGWERKNIQIIIKVNVIGRTAGTPEFVARHIW